ncbi:MAG: mechanosensitive ion channel family protein [Vicinamibacteria bacterium]
MNLLDAIQHHPLAPEIIASLGLLLVAVLLRTISVRAVRKSNLPMEIRRRWVVQIRNTTILLVILGLTVIWAAEFRAVALSIVAFAVALVIATKELILCLSGALLRARAFSVGHRIEVGHIRGDVIDVGALATRLLEVDPLTLERTGRAVTIPNSKFLNDPIINESFTSDFVSHVLRIPLSSGIDWREAEVVLRELATEECSAYLDQAKSHMERTAAEEVLDPPIVSPSTRVLIPARGQLDLLLRFPAPVRKRERVAQRIIRRFLETYPVTEERKSEVTPQTTSEQGAERSPERHPDPLS